MKRGLIIVPSSLLFLNISILKANSNRPNFVVIVTDDQTYKSINALNNKEIITPNMDRLVHEGMSFTHAFNQGSWSAAVSVASRCMIMTGNNVYSARNNDVYLNDWARIKHDAPSTAVPLWGEVFTQNGYETFITGKYHGSDYALLKNFSKGKYIGDGSYEFPSKDIERLGYNRDEKDSLWLPYDPKMGGHWNPKVRNIILNDNGGKNLSNPFILHTHSTDVYGAAAIEFLQNYDGLKPFFMYIAFNAPHDPRQSPKKFIDMYPLNKISVPESFIKEHPFDQGDHNTRDETLAPFPRTEEAIKRHLQEYYAIITHVDEVIGKILDIIEKKKLGENTYVILTSDQGLAVGNHGLMGKQNQYEHSIRMPLIIKGPNIKPNSISDEMVYMQSLYATTCDLANIAIPSTVDFKSLKPLLFDKESKGEDFILGSYRHLQRMIRTNKYKLIIYPHIKRIQLFNIETDPNETVDLSKNSLYMNMMEKLFVKLLQEHKNIGDTLDYGDFTEYK